MIFTRSAAICMKIFGSSLRIQIIGLTNRFALEYCILTVCSTVLVLCSGKIRDYRYILGKYDCKRLSTTMKIRNGIVNAAFNVSDSLFGNILVHNHQETTMDVFVFSSLFLCLCVYLDRTRPTEILSHLSRKTEKEQ